jgi:DNA-binding response OmpR family regulator
VPQKSGSASNPRPERGASIGSETDPNRGRSPRHPGYEICRRLRDRYGDAVPVLFVSGERTEAVDRLAGLLLGGDDYLVKPFEPDELLARVTSLLRRRC